MNKIEPLVHDLLKNVKSLRVLILGMGKTGMSTARFLQNQGADITIMDNRINPPLWDRIADELPACRRIRGKYDNTELARYELVVISPGVPRLEPLVVQAQKNGIPVIGDIELFAHFVTAPVIAITGSNGKSTVTQLVGEILVAGGFNAKVGGNIGIPALDLLSTSSSLTDVYVLELSSFQLESTFTLRPKIAALLNISADHMDRYENIDEYISAKARIFIGSKTAIINFDDIRIAELINDETAIAGFTLNMPQENQYGIILDGIETWLAKGKHKLIKVEQLKLQGLHNVANVLAALSICDIYGVSNEAMLAAAMEFKGLSHRMQWVGQKAGITWFNDSKATNVGAAVAAVSGVAGRIILIAGGVGKGADFTLLGNALKDKARMVILLGEDAKKIESALDVSVNRILVKGMQQAVQAAVEIAQQGDTVLLAPACASFDMYANFEERGNDFMHWVNQVAL